MNLSMVATLFEHNISPCIVIHVLGILAAYPHVCHITVLSVTVLHPFSLQTVVRSKLEKVFKECGRIRIFMCNTCILDTCVILDENKEKLNQCMQLTFLSKDQPSIGEKTL